MTSQLLPDKNRRAVILSAIAQLARTFWGPDPESCRQLLEGAFLEPFETLEPLLPDVSADVVAELKSALTRFEDVNALYEKLEATYVRLFINNREADIISLYASCHAGQPSDRKNAPLMGPAAVEMKKRLDSRGLALGADIHEPPDHISIELEYLYFLLEKGWRRNDRQLLDEAAVFAGEVMLPWISGLHRRLTNETTNWFYPSITSLLVSMLTRLGGMQAPS